MEDKKYDLYDLYESGSTLLISQNQRPITALDRNTLQEVTAQHSGEHSKTSFYFILGLYEYELPDGDKTYFLVLVTKIEPFQCFDICQVKKFTIIPLSYKKKNQTNNSEKLVLINKFHYLLDKGLNHCSMYFCLTDSYNLTLTFQQQYESRSSRKIFTWNNKAIECLKNKWPNAKCYKEVIGGYFNFKYPFIIIARKSNKNGGCHTWNRGADIEGYAANFVENEEIMIIDSDTNSEESSEQRKVSLTKIDNHINAISHIEYGGSCPLFWSQYPTMQLSRPFHFGPQEECERRFNLHFNKLSNICENKIDQKNEDNQTNSKEINESDKCILIIISLLDTEGKEGNLNAKYKELAKKRGIKFKNIKFNQLMKTRGELSYEISKLEKYFDSSIIRDSFVNKKQTKILRVNCSSCLDRTSVFMEIFFQQVFEKLQSDLFTDDNIDIHKSLWKLRSDAISREYAITKGMKTYLIDDDYQTITGKCIDHAIQVERFFYSIFYEGQCTDAYNAVLQEHRFTKFDHTEFFWKVILFIRLILYFIYLYVFEGHGLAVQTWKENIKTIVNHPHIKTNKNDAKNDSPDLRDADEYDNIDFFYLKEKSPTLK